MGDARRIEEVRRFFLAAKKKDGDVLGLGLGSYIYGWTSRS
jgi:hypothetical protein